MEIFKEYFLNSSLHGLHFIIDKRFHWTERVFWLICVLLSWAGAIALMVSAIDEYQTQQISFNIDTSYLHWKTKFPSIIICEKYNDHVDIENKRLFGNDRSGVNLLEKFVFYDGSFSTSGIKNCKLGGSFREKCLLGNFSEYMSKLRSTCSEIVGSCYFNDEEFSCCDEFLPIPSYHGTCFAFNSLISGRYLTKNALPFQLSRNLKYSYGNLSLELFHKDFFVYGMSQNAVPTRNSAAKYSLIGSSVTTGIKSHMHYLSFMSVEETSTDEDARLMSAENRGCRFPDENNLHFSKVYSMSVCENECMAKAQKKVCGCIVHSLPHNDKRDDCDFDGLVCITKYKSALISNISSSYHCLEACSNTEVKNIGHTATNIKDTGIPFQDERSVVRINFLVTPPYFRYSRSVVKTPLSILVSVGGTVGLFIGASLLTVVEIFYYFFMRPLGSKYLKLKKCKESKSLKSFKEKSRKGLIKVERREYFQFVN